MLFSCRATDVWQLGTAKSPDEKILRMRGRYTLCIDYCGSMLWNPKNGFQRVAFQALGFHQGGLLFILRTVSSTKRMNQWIFLVDPIGCKVCAGGGCRHSGKLSALHPLRALRSSTIRGPSLHCEHRESFASRTSLTVTQPLILWYSNLDSPKHRAGRLRRCRGQRCVCPTFPVAKPRSDDKRR